MDKVLLNRSLDAPLVPLAAAVVDDVGLLGIEMPEAELLEAEMLEVKILEVEMLESELLEAEMPEVELLEAEMLEVKSLEVEMLETELMEVEMLEVGLLNSETLEVGLLIAELSEVATSEVLGMLGRLDALEEWLVVVGLLDKLVTVTVAWLADEEIDEETDEELLVVVLLAPPRVIGVKISGPDSVLITGIPSNLRDSTQSISCPSIAH